MSDKSIERNQMSDLTTTQPTPKSDHYCDLATIMQFANREVVTDEDMDIRSIAIDLLEYRDEEIAEDEADTSPTILEQGKTEHVGFELAAMTAERDDLQRENAVLKRALDTLAPNGSCWEFFKINALSDARAEIGMAAREQAEREI